MALKLWIDDIKEHATTAKIEVSSRGGVQKITYDVPADYAATVNKTIFKNSLWSSIIGMSVGVSMFVIGLEIERKAKIRSKEMLRQELNKNKETEETEQ